MTVEQPQNLEREAPHHVDALADLLDGQERIRRSAFAEAVSRRRIDRGSRTVVWAVLVDDEAGSAQAERLGRRVAAAPPGRAVFLRLRDSVLYLVTRESATGCEFERVLHDEARALGVGVSGYGSARHDPADDELGPTAERARTAAELTAAVPELRPGSAIEDLGGWVLLHSVPAARGRLALISPAAEQLLRVGDAVQRETVETYLDAGGQVRAACAVLHIHRTTLYYRLENMPELVREALDDGMKRSTLHLALKLARLWEARGAL